MNEMNNSFYLDYYFPLLWNINKHSQFSTLFEMCICIVRDKTSPYHSHELFHQANSWTFAEKLDCKR